MPRRLLLILLLLPALVFAETFVAGKDYEIVGDGNDRAGGKIAVTEFFSYGCPWCFKLDPAITTWRQEQADTIQFNRVPVVFHPEWIYYAKACYAAELLGLSNKLDPLLFKAIQTDKKHLDSDQAMIDFFIAQGVSKDMAESAFTHSTMIDVKVGEGNALMGRFHINAVPAIVVANRYKTDLQMAQDEKRLFKVMDYLVTLAKKPG